MAQAYVAAKVGWRLGKKVAIGLVVVIVGLAAIMLGSENPPPPPASGCSGGAGVIAAARPVAGYSRQQVGDAVVIINTAKQMGLTKHDQELGVMVSMDESGLIPKGQNGITDAQGRAYGIFQQTPYTSGGSWGTKAQVMNPVYAAKKFFEKLKTVPNRDSMLPTLAGHATQGNLDPYVYQSFWKPAVRLVNTLSSGAGAQVAKTVVAAGPSTGGCMSDGSHFTASGIPYVGHLPPAALMARAKTFVNSGGGWYGMCQSFVAHLSGNRNSGYGTAMIGWQTFVHEHTAHQVGKAADAGAPPIGAWLYYSASDNPAGHVAVYLGNGKVASTDVFKNDHVGIGPASAITNGPWHLQYLGWAAPWGAKTKFTNPQSSGGGGGSTQTASGSNPGSVQVSGTGYTGTVTVSQANIPTRSGWGGFDSSMPRVLSHNPDVVSLNEQFARSLSGIESATGHRYGAYRVSSALSGPGGSQARDEVILWRKSTWHLVAGGRVLLVRDLEPPSHAGRGIQHRPRVAMWVILRRNGGGNIAVISTHMPVNPDKFGFRLSTRRSQYATAMNRLTGLASTLSAHGPVIVAGDMNVHPSQLGEGWAAPTLMKAIGYGWYTQDVDYIWNPPGSVITGTWTGHMVSDHPWIAARIRLN